MKYVGFSCIILYKESPTSKTNYQNCNITYICMPIYRQLCLSKARCKNNAVMLCMCFIDIKNIALFD